jgi:hypothetical protein
MPFTLFCDKNNPELGLELLKSLKANIEYTGNSWNASIKISGKFFSKPKNITFKFDEEWCSPPNWPNQIMGMKNYFSQFPVEAVRNSDVQNLISNFNYAIAIICEPEIEKQDDPRYEIMAKLAEKVQGYFFTPSALLDSQYRTISATDGEADPQAEFSTYESNTKFHVEPEEIDPPSAQRVWKRLYVFTALAARGLLEMNLLEGNTPAYNLEELITWFEALEIGDELESHEKEIIYAKEQELNQQNAINSVWTFEALAVLAWSLKVANLPSYDALVNVDELLTSLSFLDIPACKRNLRSESLRSAEELDEYQDQILAYDWRMVDFRVNQRKIDYASVNIGSKRFDLSWAVLKEGDLSLQDVKITEANPDLVAAMGSLSMERHKASNWLQGFDKLYSNITPDT